MGRAASRGLSKSAVRWAFARHQSQMAQARVHIGVQELQATGHEVPVDCGEDNDSVSATAHEFDAAGRMITAVDVTEKVIDHLKDMIRDDTWTTSPHPILNDYFSAWSEEVERDRAQDLEHERVESAMLNI